MDARAIIARLRKGETPSADEIAWFANGLATGAVSDAQAGAFAMGVCLRGLGDAGRVALTAAMRDSGDVLVWRLDRPVLDKHSTGGLGDAVSLILAPALAACGVAVPMISGRGLGHTGGTLDKIEAIPGVKAQIDEATLRRIVAEVGCAVVGATGRIAPADKRLYAIRDVTGTVESIDLITASILSKKLAAGLQGLVLDVKVGSGAFMKTQDEAMALAQALVTTAKGAGCPTAALITDMDEPLCPALGNAVEVALCMEVMAGNRLAAPRLHDLTVALGGRLLALAFGGRAWGGTEGRVGAGNEDRGGAGNEDRGGAGDEAGGGAGDEAGDEAGGAAQIAAAIADGRAMDHFARMVAALGGPPDMAEDWRTHLPAAPVIGDVVAPEAGHVAAWDGEALGLAVVAMGGGRRIETDRIDPAVGLTDVVGLGAWVERGQPLATIHARDAASAEAAAQAILAAVTIGAAPPPRALILARVG